MTDYYTEPSLFERVAKENWERLENCSRPHVFERVEAKTVAPYVFLPGYRCIKCNGFINSEAHYWYQLGLQAGKEPHEDS